MWLLRCSCLLFFGHGQVEVLNRHVVDLPERVAGLPKELESRESPIPYDYDLSIEDPQDRVCTNYSVGRLVLTRFFYYVRYCRELIGELAESGGAFKVCYCGAMMDGYVAVTRGIRRCLAYCKNTLSTYSCQRCPE